MRKPYAPRNLGPGGRRLWTSVLNERSLRPDELRILEDACRECDLVDEMESEQKGAPKTAKGSQGQPVAAPLVPELRQHRATLATLLRALNLGQAETVNAAVEAEKARQARAAEIEAAQARWTTRRMA